MAPTNAAAKLQSFTLNLTERLGNNGFKKVDARRINARLIDEGLMKRGGDCGLLKKGEALYNLGLGSKRSNFSVFIKQDSANGRVLVYYMNPDASEKAPMREKNKKGSVLPGQNYFILKSYSTRDNADASAEAIVKDIMHYASLKPESEYRKESHLHCGRMFEGFTGEQRFADDGMSSIIDVLRTMAITNRDVVAVTSHNSFNAKQFAAISIIAEEMGIVMLPATELTTVTTDPNGPHVLCYGAHEAAMHELELLAFRGRKSFSMPPFNNVGRLLDVIPKLYSRLVHGAKSLFMAPAHTFNLYKEDKPVYDVGIISAVETGNISLGAVEGILPLFQGVEAWNMTMSQQDPIPRLRDQNLSEFVHETCTRHLPQGTRHTPNSFAFAFAKELLFEREVYHTTVGSDDHYTPPMNYKCNGILQARGHTRIDLIREYPSMPDRKPTSEELISMLLENRAFMRAHVYSQLQEGYLRVPWGRREYDPWTGKLSSRMEKAGMRKYARAIAKDIAAGRVNATRIKNLMAAYGIGD